jgi:hypothetical protein
MGRLPFRMAFFTICCPTISPWLRFTVLPPIRATTVLQNSRIRISPKLARSFGPTGNSLRSSAALRRQLEPPTPVPASCALPAPRACRAQRRGRLFEARGCLHCGGQRFESPPLHQVVRANRRDFLRHRIARHFSSLPRQGPVSVGGRRFSEAIPGASCRKSLAAKFRFQGCCLPHVHRARFRMGGRRTSTLDPVRMDGSPLAGRQTSRGGSFLTPASAPGVRARATDPARPSAGRRDA